MQRPVYLDSNDNFYKYVYNLFYVLDKSGEINENNYCH